jgi:hypothetical protein
LFTEDEIRSHIKDSGLGPEDVFDSKELDEWAENNGFEYRRY